jgi:hypothetical protein
MEDYATELRKLAAVLDEAKYETNLAREQSTKPKHLYIRTHRAMVQAARAVMAAVDVGFTELLPPSLPWKRQPDGTLSDTTAFTVWKILICPVMRSRPPKAKANAGTFDFPRIKTNDEGQVVGRDGTPLVVVDRIDPTTGKVVGQYLDGEAGAITDDYDEADAMVHLRCQAADWVDACGVAANLLREEVSMAGNKDTSKQVRKKTPGRKKRDYATIQKEADLVAKWERAKKAGVSKMDFVKDLNDAKEWEGDFTDFKRLQDRVYRDQNPRADN